MSMSKKFLIQGALAALVGAGAMVAMATPASAYVACNRFGDCWHVRDRYTYHPSWGITVHDDHWRWRAHERYRWREHHGRGYWRGGVWVTF
jgi:hypothetical protein